MSDCPSALLIPKIPMREPPRRKSTAACRNLGNAKRTPPVRRHLTPEEDEPVQRVTVTVRQIRTRRGRIRSPVAVASMLHLIPVPPHDRNP